MNATERPARRITLRDVAAAAGVTASTVSKVVNGRHDVGAVVRDRVLRTIAELGYRPNAVARGLRTQRSQTIALISDDLEGIFTATLMRGVERAAAEADIAVFLCNTYGDAATERRHLQRLADKQVDGLIFMSGNRVGARGEPAGVIPSDVPYLFLYEYASSLAVPSVLPDDYGGARLALDHLADVGCRRIAYINGPHGWEATEDRERGYRDGLAAHALSEDERLVRRSRTWDPEDGYDLTVALLEEDSTLDAIFCASDDLASGALVALRERDVSVPGDVRVVGFDDRPFARHQRPSLSSVALPLEEMGRLAGEMLLRAIAGETIPEGIVRVPCELRARASSARE